MQNWSGDELLQHPSKNDNLKIIISGPDRTGQFSDPADPDHRIITRGMRVIQ
jgi:hypothetical protein